MNKGTFMLGYRMIAGVALGGLLLGSVGCENLPGSDKSQGAVIGGVGGAVIGAAVGGEKHRLLGAILGGALGAGGGYVIGAQAGKIKNKDHDSAERAHRKATERPATADEAKSATTADINSDGFVTLDEVVAMEKAGFSDRKMLDRLEATGQVFELTSDNRQYLRDHGVSSFVIEEMEDLNQDQRNSLLGEEDDDNVISK